MELAGTNTEEHVVVAALLGILTFVFHDVHDIRELGVCPPSIFASFSSQAAQDVATFLLATNLAEPARTLWEEPDDGEEKEEGDDLEGDWKPPAEGGIATVDERQTKFKPVSDDNLTSH